MLYLIVTSEPTTSPFPSCEKNLVHNGCLKHVTPEHKHGNHASLPSTNHEVLNIIPEEDINKGEFRDPLFWISMSISEITSKPCLVKDFNWDWSWDISGRFNHRWKRKSPPSLWVMAGGVVNWARVSFIACVHNCQEGKDGHFYEPVEALWLSLQVEGIEGSLLDESVLSS